MQRFLPRLSTLSSIRSRPLPSSRLPSLLPSSSIPTTLARSFSIAATAPSPVTPPCDSASATATASATFPKSKDKTQSQVPLNLRNSISRCAAVTPRGITLKDLYSIGKITDHQVSLETSARWLAAELPVRLARRVVDLESLDAIDGLGQSKGIQTVHRMYVDSFRDVVSARELVAAGDLDGFAKVLEGVKDRHKDVVAIMARGIFEWKASRAQLRKGSSYEGEATGYRNGVVKEQVKNFLNTFYMTRIGIRVLIGHFLELFEVHKPGYAGIINMKCRPFDMANKAGNFAKHLAYAHYGESPDIQILGATNLEFPYVEGHIYLCLFELLKNSLRATIETHQDSDSLPPVKVIIADGAEDITIKISDEGGGIPRSGMDKIWTYMYTTANTPSEKLMEMENMRNRNRPDPIAGFGFGIPLTATYARYFGGELTIIGMDGYGTDAYLHLCKLGNKKEHIL